jgi:hypothetical protein
LARIDEPIAGKRKLSDEVLEGGVESSLTEMSNEELMAKRSIWPAHRLLICVHLVLASDSIAISTVPPRRLARRRPLEHARRPQRRHGRDTRCRQCHCKAIFQEEKEEGCGKEEMTADATPADRIRRQNK